MRGILRSAKHIAWSQPKGKPNTANPVGTENRGPYSVWVALVYIFGVAKKIIKKFSDGDDSQNMSVSTISFSDDIVICLY
jgi:hypothetical protein